MLLFNWWRIFSFPFFLFLSFCFLSSCHSQMLPPNEAQLGLQPRRNTHWKWTGKYLAALKLPTRQIWPLGPPGILPAPLSVAILVIMQGEKKKNRAIVPSHTVSSSDFQTFSVQHCKGRVTWSEFHRTCWKLRSLQFLSSVEFLSSRPVASFFMLLAWKTDTALRKKLGIKKNM